MTGKLEFATITDVDGLEDALAQSQACTVILFNHDPYCPVSAAAFDEMRGAAGDVRLIDVSRQRDVTRELAQRTGIRHESPQVIVLRDGAATWSASHFRITAEAVAKAVGDAA
jgi:bacillithiol system protein YtxJ